MNAAVLIAWEQSVLDTPVDVWITEAEDEAERRWLAQHGPDDAPPRPRWPVEWCVNCGWMPLGTAHACGISLDLRRRDVPPAPPEFDPGERSWH